MATRSQFLRPDPPPLRLGRALEGPVHPPKRYPLMWAITLSAMSVVAVSSWVFSMYVFSHPEEPIPHKLLSKLKRIDPPKRFDIYGVPPGKAFNERDAYAKYRRFLSLSQAEMRGLNARFIREYISNYRRADPVDYVSGTFRITEVVPLHSGSFLPEGLAVRARSTEVEDLEIEYLMPGPNAKVGLFQPGDDLVLEAKRAYAAVLQFSPLDGQRLCLSLIPLVYGPHTPPDGQRLDLEPPSSTNPESLWPLSAHPRVQSATPVEAPVPVEATPAPAEEDDQGGLAP